MYSDNEVVISLMTEKDGQQVPVDGASVKIRDALNPDSEWEDYPYTNGTVLIPINKLTADQFDLFHIEAKIDPTAQGYRDVSYEDLDLERGVLYTCMLTPLDSPTNDLAAARPYVYMMTFNKKDIMQSEYEMIYSPANDHKFDIHVGVRNPSGEELSDVKLIYYKNNGAHDVEYVEVEPTSLDGDVYTFTGAWKQEFSPYATESERPAFIMTDSAGMQKISSQLVSLKSATDVPINEGTGAEGGVFANVLGKGFSGSFKIPFINVNFKLDLPLTKYWPKLCINPCGYAVAYVGTDVFEDEIKDLSLTHWESEDMKDYRNAQKKIEEKDDFANYKAQWDVAWDYYKQKGFKCLGEYSLDFGWFAVAAGRWELDNTVEDVLSRNITFTVSCGITIGLNASWNIIPIPPVPLFYISVSVGLSVGFSTDFTLETCWVDGGFGEWDLRPVDNFTVDIGFLFAVQMGVGVKGFADIYARGAFTFDMIFMLAMDNPASILITLAVDITAGVTVFFVSFSKTWNLVKKQLYPSESVSNLLAHFMNAGGDEFKDKVPAYGEPLSYPWLVEKANEELCANPDFVNYWAAGNYKVVRAGDRMYVFYIGTAENPDGKTHKRLAWNLLDGDTNLSQSGSLQTVIDSPEAKDSVSGGTEWIAAINRRDDYAFDVFGQGDYIYVVATCANEFDEDGFPVPNDLTDGSALKNMVVYITVLEPDGDGKLTHLLSLTDTRGHNYVFGAESISYKADQCERYDYESFTSPRIAYAGEKWKDGDGEKVFQNFEMYGEMPRISYPEQDPQAGATGFIYRGWMEFTLSTEKLVQNGMGDGYERAKILTMDTGSYSDLSGRGSLGFVALSRPKNGGAGDSAIELFNFYMNNGENEDNRKTAVIETGAINDLVLVEDLKWAKQSEDHSMVFYTKEEINEEGAVQNRLYGLHIEPAEGNAHELHIEVKRYEYDVVIPATSFDVCYIKGMPYLYWIACSQKKSENDEDVWSVWAMCYDEESNIMSSPFVLAQFRMPTLTYWIEGPDASSSGITVPLDGILGNVMLTGTGTGYLNAIAKDIEDIPVSVRPDTAPVSLLSFPEMLKPSASLTSAIPKSLVVKAGSFDDMSMSLMNDGNVAISVLDFAMYDVAEDGTEKLVETAHIDAQDPNNNQITMADGTVVQSGAAAGYREEDYDNTSRRRDWILDHDSTKYNIHMEDTGIAVDSEVLEPGNPYYVRTDVLMPGSVGCYTASFKIPDDWEGGTRTLRMKISALSTYANWTRAMARAAGATVRNAGGSGDEGLVELRYVLNEKTGRLELQKPANLTAPLADAIKSGLVATQLEAGSVPLTVQVHDLEVSHRVYRGLGGERWLDIAIRNHAATRENMKLVCAVYVDGSKEPTYISLPYYEDATLSRRTQTITLPLRALVDDPDAHRMARVEILSVDRDERAYANNEFTVYLGGRNPLHFTRQPRDVIAQEGEDVSFSVEVNGGTQPYGYRWQVFNPKTGKWVDLEGFTEATILREHIEKKWDGAIFRCVVTDARGTEIVSAVAKLTVRDSIPTGDSSRLPLYLAAALAALLLLALLRKRIKRA